MRATLVVLLAFSYGCFAMLNEALNSPEIQDEIPALFANPCLGARHQNSEISCQNECLEIAVPQSQIGMYVNHEYVQKTKIAEIFGQTILRNTLSKFWPKSSLNQQVEKAFSRINLQEIRNNFGISIDVALELVALQLYQAFVVIDDSAPLRIFNVHSIQDRREKRTQIKAAARSVMDKFAKLIESFRGQSITALLASMDCEDSEAIYARSDLEEFFRLAEFNALFPISAKLFSPVIDILWFENAPKPELLLVLMHSPPIQEKAMIKKIRRKFRKLEKSTAGKRALALIFVQIGDNPKTARFFDRIKQEVGEFVHVAYSPKDDENSDKWFIETLLKAINPEFRLPEDPKESF